MPVIALRAASRAPQSWRNGGGVTFEVARRSALAPSAHEFLWRVSIASVSLAGPFSSFAGFERLITVIEGDGMRLRGLAADDVELRPFAVCRFDGAVAVEGLLPHGPVSDLNVIYDPLSCRASLSVIEGPVIRRPCACADLLIVNLAAAQIAWTCDAQTGALGRLDALWVDDPRSSVALHDVERAALIEIDGA